MDAPAAYLASLGGCATACRELDPQYGAAGLADQPHAQQAAAAINSKLQATHLLLGMKQKALTTLLDNAGWHQQLASAPVVGRALLRSRLKQGRVLGWLLCQPGASAWRLLLSPWSCASDWAARAGLQPELEKPGLLLPQR